MARHPRFIKRVVDFYTKEVPAPATTSEEADTSELVVYNANNINKVRKLRWGRVVGVPAAILLGISLLIGKQVAENKNEQMGLEGPSKDNLAYVEDLGEQADNRVDGSQGKEFGKEEAEENFNNVVSQNPVNENKATIEQLVNGTLTFNFSSNGAPVQNVYAFDAQNSKYTLTQTTDLTLRNGKVITTTNVVEGRYSLNDGKLVLFEDAGLNAGDDILGNTSQPTDQYADIIYINNGGKIIGTISGVALEGTSSVYSAPTQTTPEDTAGPSLEPTV